MATQTISGTITGGSITLTREGSPVGLVAATLDLIWPVDDSASDPGLRQYVYLTADFTSGIIPKAVNVLVHDENMPAGTKTYTVDFGDGVTVGPQSSPNFAHTFTTGGTFPMIPRVDVT